jgi:hypothetical protein
MSTEKKNPDGDNVGVRESIQPINGSEYRPAIELLQVIFVSRRLRVTHAMAAVVAALAFDNGGRP